MKWVEMYKIKNFFTKKANNKLVIDALMITDMIFLMSYELLGSKAHEIIGIIMFLLVVFHHFLNINWAKNLLKGRQTPIRIFQNLLIFLVIVSLITSMISGVIISRHLFKFLPFKYTAIAGKMHMLAADWGFIYMSFHLGLHFNMFAVMIKNKSNFSSTVKIVIKILLILLFAYGVFAFFNRDLADYLF